MEKVINRKRVEYDFIAGIIILIGLGILFSIGKGLLLAYREWGNKLLYVPLSVLSIWLIGHILNGIEEAKCDHCEYVYSHHNILSVWRHNKKCLPYLTKSVNK